MKITKKSLTILVIPLISIGIMGCEKKITIESIKSEIKKQEYSKAIEHQKELDILVEKEEIKTDLINEINYIYEDFILNNLDKDKAIEKIQELGKLEEIQELSMLKIQEIKNIVKSKESLKDGSTYKLFLYSGDIKKFKEIRVADEKSIVIKNDDTEKIYEYIIENGNDIKFETDDNFLNKKSYKIFDNYLVENKNSNPKFESSEVNQVIDINKLENNTFSCTIENPYGKNIIIKIDFLKDNKYEMIDGSINENGTYSIDNEIITFKSNSNRITKYLLKDNILYNTVYKK